MKKLTFLIAFALVFFYGCNKQESIKTDDIQNIESSSITIYQFNIDGDHLNSTAVSISKSDLSVGQSAILKANNNQHANGHYHTQAGSETSGSATVNNGGVHGNINLNFASGETLKLSTTGLEIEGNQAAIGGQITQTSGFPEGHPLSVIGNYVYILVEDNGEGNNDPSDRYSGLSYFSPEEFGDLTYYFTPSSGFWDPDFIFDTAEESDQIQVSGGN